ncbi:AMP-dependent synthetase/ligase [Bergeyella cardium]|uniref:AMP-binding protein n=1 Tax=Bergeyella cardium TaxID=1585976 RepID=A0A6P1QUX0_9FLAO|nr:long-chain fatty acid--CoA ligase [Bergeyella cardium]QHN65826.1 AMP-binding protein [Bergeyella cardium]WHE33425.1 long-chain fatty acid--CoA ligase [Bergeyella cardium]WHF60075.1 long-chain fatty acid--CoA ligase [Bergeyella cardium]
MKIERLFDIARNYAENFPKADMFATKRNGKWEKTSTAEFISLGNKFSRGLLKLGISPGDKISLITSATCTEWAAVDFGALQIGVITVPVYPTISPADYEFIFNDAEIKYCFVSDKKLLQKVEEIKAKVPSLQGIFTFEEVEGAANWIEIIDLGESEATQNEVEDLSNAIRAEDLATLIYTSGTTGRPKGVMLTHRNIIANIEGCYNITPIRKGLSYKNTRVLSFLPICHIFERMLFYFFQCRGFSFYFAESFDKLGENIKEVKPHYMTVVPRVLEKVYDKIYQKGTANGGLKSKIFHWAIRVAENKKGIGKPKGIKEKLADKLVFKKWREGLGGEIITLVSGSASLSERLNKIYQNAGIPILEGYGLTETSPVVAVNSFDRMKIGTVGPIVKNLDVKIQPDGEISVKGESIFKSYYNNEELTQEAFTEDGYFKTGDIGFIDEEGFLKITDRKKEMFKTSGGKYIAPQIIENLAKSSKFIERIMVVGDGEKMPCAIVQPDFSFAKNWAIIKHYNIGETPEQMSQDPKLKARIEKEIAKINTSLGNWEQIKKIELSPEIWSIEGGELTPTLKLKRKNIKEKYIALYNKLYEQ